MVQFDTISKRLIQTYPDDFVRFALGRDNVDVVALLDTEHRTVQTRRADSRLRVRINGQEALMHTEFQTADSTDPPMPFRMASYIGRLVEEYRLPVYAHVIYLRPNAGRRDPGQYTQAGAGRSRLIF